jgi:protein Tex
VHISELSNKFIKDPSEAVKTGQIVKVKVLSVDAKTMRIGLSMKALMGPGPTSRPQGKKVDPPAPASFQDKLAALSTKWGGK